jgi:HNH endonuclease
MTTKKTPRSPVQRSTRALFPGPRRGRSSGWRRRIRKRNGSTKHVTGRATNSSGRAEGTATGEFPTLTFSLPIELLRSWNEAYELAERLSGCELEKFQVLEPMIAEFVSTCLPAENEECLGPHATKEEQALAPDVRKAVFERDGYRCQFPGCSLRKMLDPHHVVYRSHGGSDEPSNLTTICRIHHGLIHRGICRIFRNVSGELVFERPPLFSEKKQPSAAPPVTAVDELEEVAADDESTDWPDETVAAILKESPAPKAESAHGDYGDFLLAWVDRRVAEQRERPARRRDRARGARYGGKRVQNERVFAAAGERGDLRKERRASGIGATSPGGNRMRRIETGPDT